MQNIADILVDPEGQLERRQSLGEDQPLPSGRAILHVLYAEKDKTLAGVRRLPVRSSASHPPPH